MRGVCGGVKRHVHLLCGSVLSCAYGAVEVKRDHTGVFCCVGEVQETVHPPRPLHPPLLPSVRPGPRRSEARHLRLSVIPDARGLTRSSRPLYSAGFATSAFPAERDMPLWRNW